MTPARRAAVLAVGAVVAGAVVACGRDMPGAAGEVFEELRLPPGVTVLRIDAGPDEAIYQIGSPRPLTAQDIGFPPRFGYSTLREEGEKASCFGFRLSEPAPSEWCDAYYVALRYGPSPKEPSKRYCTLDVTQWDEVRTVDGRQLHLGVVGIHCNRPRGELGPDLNARFDRSWR